MVTIWVQANFLWFKSYLLVSSADNFCKQFGPRSGPTKCCVRSSFKLFDTLMVYLIESFEIVKKKSTDIKKSSKIF